MPTTEQLKTLYEIGFWLTYRMMQPIVLMCVDARTRNLFILAGDNETIEIEILPNGRIQDEPD
ncbi:MAG: hypothetical protein HC860_20800 [Alkalinema sp. RU_4_3]|nr:hypothetical protein [Alkalinema sp. RU_4_3]